MPELKSQYPPEVVDEPERVVNGLWSLSYDRLTLVDAGWSGKPVILVPTEDVRLLIVDLPIANRTQRLAALPFAIEDVVAEPLEALHAALGPEVSAGRYLAGAVRHDRMAVWCALAAEAGLGDAPMTPDALALPTPAVEGWSVASGGGRVLVRTSTGAGFAVPSAAFEPVWISAGRPALASYGEPLTQMSPHDLLVDDWATWPILAQPVTLDLRQGRYGVQSRGAPWLRRAAMVLSIGLLAHMALLALDTVALMRSADAKQDVVAGLVTAAGGPAEGDVAATAEAMLPQSSGASSSLMPLFSRAAKALQPLGTTVTVQSVTYASDAGLTLALEASDLAGLQKAQAALSSAGLNPVSGGALVEGGRARETMTLPVSARTGSAA